MNMNNMMNNQMRMGNIGMVNPMMMNNPMIGMGNMGMMNFGNFGYIDPNWIMMMNQAVMNMNMGNTPLVPNNGGNMPVIAPIDDPSDAQGWNLLFENQNDSQSYIIRISEQKTFQKAIDKYRALSMNIERCQFIYNSKQIFPEMKICETGLLNNCKITVISTGNLRGGKL